MGDFQIKRMNAIHSCMLRNLKIPVTTVWKNINFNFRKFVPEHRKQIKIKNLLSKTNIILRKMSPKIATITMF